MTCAGPGYGVPLAVFLFWQQARRSTISTHPGGTLAPPGIVAPKDDGELQLLGLSLTDLLAQRLAA